MPDKLTDNSDEAYVQDLFDARAIFEVPYFQRPYKWEPKRLRRFESDLVRLADDGDLNDTHFLGAVILQGSQSRVPAESSVYQVIDGQQRLTTMFIYLLATIQELITFDEVEDAKQLFESFIVVAKPPPGKSNIKIQSCGEDRESMNTVIQGILNLKNFKNCLDKSVIPLISNTVNSNDRISKNFREATKFLTAQRQEFGMSGIERVRNLNAAMLTGMSVVQINVKNPLSGPKIFDALNSEQQPMTVGELVKNDIFQKGMGNQVTDIDVLYNETWEPFYAAFGPPKNALFDNYFFPYGLIEINPTVRKGDVYTELRKSWEDKTSVQIIEGLSKFQPDYLDFHLQGNRCGHSAEVTQLITNLRNLGLPTSLFSFLMKISFQLRNEQLNEETAKSVLKATESFLVRRGVYGLEPSGLHAAFKGLWNSIISDIAREEINSGNFLKSYFKKIEDSVVQWPNNTVFRDSFITRNLYGRKITPYILTEYNNSLGSDGIGGDFEIEHVLPQSPDSSWDSFLKETRESVVNNIGNLTLLSVKMNRDVSNGPYALKRAKFSNESRFRVTRDLGDDNEFWTKESIIDRANKIADWALLRWPECPQPVTNAH